MDYADEFYRLHDLWAENFFIGKDQQIYNAMFYLKPHRVVTFDAKSVDNSCVDIWFYYQHWLGRPDEIGGSVSLGCKVLPITSFSFLLVSDQSLTSACIDLDGVESSEVSIPSTANKPEISTYHIVIA